MIFYKFDIFTKKRFNIKNEGFVANESSYEHKTKIHPSGEQKKAFFDDFDLCVHF